MDKKVISCAFNIDTACVEAKYENTQLNLRVLQLVGKSPKPFESQVPCELRTPKGSFCHWYG